jgi:thymidylate synthase (FAD)
MNVTYIDHMGDDLAVVNAARVSFDKVSQWEYVTETTEPDWAGLRYDLTHEELSKRDQRLINYLAKNNHWTPFGHPQITLREKVPIFVARERFRHTIGFVYNEVSRRYVDSEPEFYTPDVWRKRAEDKKQGSTEESIELRMTEYHGSGYDMYKDTLVDTIDCYDRMLDAGVCPEQARMVLPQSMYTEYVCTGSLAAFARAYNLRSDPHAQKEIQDLASQWDTIIRPLFPHSWSALTDV